MSRFLIKGEVQNFKRGQTVFQMGEPMDKDQLCVFFVMDGRVQLAQRFPGQRIVTNVARIGDVFGVETSFSKGMEKWQFSAVCTKDTQVYAWNRNNYEIILGTYAEIAKTTIVNQSRWLRKINKLVGELDSKGMTENMVHPL